MSKGQMFRALVNEWLVAAAKDICTLYKRMIAENEEELRQCEEENQRKQQLLDQALSPRVLLNRVGPGPGLNHEMTQTLRIKEEPEERDATQEQEQLSVPESSAHVSSELHLHDEGITENCVDTDSYEDWTRPLSWSEADMETESDGDQNNQVQIRGRSTKRSARNRPASETSATVHPPRPDGGERTKHQCSVRRKRFSCSFCDKSFAFQKQRDIHIRIHTGEKPYSCAVCDKAFAQKNNWDRHIRTHTGERPYSCSVCDKAFSQKNNWDRHIRTHTGERPYSCSVCDRTFAHSSAFKRHKKTHTEERP